MPPDNRLVFDVGMHNGDDTAFYLHRGYHVVAIEADPSLASGARARFSREIAAGQLILLNVGIGPVEGAATFWLCEGRSEWNSFERACSSREGRTCRPIEVPCRRFGGILREYGIPHYLKIDIETHDRYCLADLSADHLPRYISIELTALAELMKLRELGYDAFKLVLQGRHRAVLDETATLTSWFRMAIRPFRALAWLEKKSVSMAQKLARFGKRLSDRLLQRIQQPDWVFPLGSSGPFGDEAPGDWIDFEEAVFRWLALERLHPGHWCDVHATQARVTGRIARGKAA